MSGVGVDVSARTTEYSYYSILLPLTTTARVHLAYPHNDMLLIAGGTIYG